MPTYSVFGLSLGSDMPLPELHACVAPAAVDVAIRHGRIAPLGPEEKSGYTVTADGALLTIPTVARYWISAGREIVYEPAPAVSERNLRLFLLGSALGALLHQRGLLPLHANALEIDGSAVAFMGHSGAGKSTMAAWFHDRGFNILADDVCVVAQDQAGRPIAHAGIPRLRLWREALEASGRTAGDYEASFDDVDKYDVPTTALRRQPLPLPLSRIYLLGKAATGAQGTIRRLQGMEAVDALIANTYRGAYVTLSGDTRRHLEACLKLVRSVPVFSAERVWGYDSFETEAAAIEAHTRAAAPP